MEVLAGLAILGGIRYFSNGRNVKKPPDVHLTPPVFSREQPATKRLSRCGVDNAFGREKLAALFSEYFVASDTICTGHLKMAPDAVKEQGANIVARFSAKRNGRGANNEGCIDLNWSATPATSRPRDVVADIVGASIQLSNTGGIVASGCFFRPAVNAGAFFRVPPQGPSSVPAAVREGCHVGARYSSPGTSVGAIFRPFAAGGSTLEPWVVRKVGDIVAGLRCFVGTDLAVKDFSGHLAYEQPSEYPNGSRFVMALALEGVGGNSKATASYYHHFVQRRAIVNPLADWCEKTITNYVDVGVEVSRRTAPIAEVVADNNGAVDDIVKAAAVPCNGDGDDSIKAAVAWQVNKAVLLKAKVGASSGSLSVATKLWGSPGGFPGVTAVACATIPWAGSQETSGWGFRFEMENFGKVRYDREASQRGGGGTPHSRWENARTSADHQREWEDQRMPEGRDQSVFF